MCHTVTFDQLNVSSLNFTVKNIVGLTKKNKTSMVALSSLKWKN